jgi:hypothetical protein
LLCDESRLYIISAHEHLTIDRINEEGSCSRETYRPAGLWFIDPNVIAQSNPIGLAYQVTNADNATFTFSPDGKRIGCSDFAS